MTRGLQEPNPEFPLEVIAQYLLIQCSWKLYRTTISNKNQLHTQSYSFVCIFFLIWGQDDVQGVWLRLSCLSGLGWSWLCAAEVPVLPSGTEVQLGTLILPKCSTLTCSWATVSTHPLTTPLLETYSGPHRAQPNPSTCGGPKFPKFSHDLTQWLLQVFSLETLSDAEGRLFGFSCPQSFHPIVQTALCSHSKVATPCFRTRQ